jgi:hypothetical protein
MDCGAESAPWDDLCPACLDNELLLGLDAAIYGVRITDVTGKRIDPQTVSSDPDSKMGTVGG